MKHVAHQWSKLRRSQQGEYRALPVGGSTDWRKPPAQPIALTCSQRAHSSVAVPPLTCRVAAELSSETQPHERVWLLVRPPQKHTQVNTLPSTKRSNTLDAAQNQCGEELGLLGEQRHHRQKPKSGVPGRLGAAVATCCCLTETQSGGRTSESFLGLAMSVGVK